MAYAHPAPKVALVFPPYGPQFIPPLGLALLSTGVKQLGFECRSFFWNLDILRALPGSTTDDRIQLYEAMTKHALAPLNEWLFRGIVFPDLDDDPRTLRRLDALESRPRGLSSLKRRTGPAIYRETFHELRDSSRELVGAMVDRLASFDVVGIASTFFQNMPALALARSVKERWPHKIVVLGGANCDDSMGPSLLELFPFLDYTFSGEVDFSFPQFIQRLSEGASVEDVPGLAYRDAGGRVVTAPAVAPIENMNSLPLPDYDDFVVQRAASDIGDTTLPLTIALESSRGCWWGAKQHCVFCGLNANGMAFRQKDYDRFQSEVETVVERYQPRFLFMTDNILSAGYYKEFADWARRRGLGVDFFYEIKANLTRAQVEGMADSGISWIQPGIESFSSRTLTLMKKGVRGIQNVALLKYARDYGMKTSYGILGGFTGEDPDEHARMNGELPKLTHLEPPAGAWMAQYHRFSPMFREPPSKLRPTPEYFELYPMPEDVISRFAYYFETVEQQEFVHLDAIKESVNQWRQAWDPVHCTLTWKESQGDVLITDRRPGYGGHDFRLTGHAVTVFHALDKPRQLLPLARELSKQPAGAHSLLAAPSDAGTARGARFLRMVPAGVRTEEAADSTLPKDASPRDDHAAAHSVEIQRGANPAEIVVSFTQDEFAENPQACVQVLIDKGILFVEDDWYVALPVRASYRRQERMWAYQRRSRIETLLRNFSLKRGLAGNRGFGA